jgi:hypothetical protein
VHEASPVEPTPRLMWGVDEDDLVGWGDEDPEEAMGHEVREVMAEANAVRREAAVDGADGAEGDDGADDAPPARGTGSAHQRRVAASAFASLHAAREHIDGLMQEQINRATEEGTPANQTLSGDSRVHMMLVTLLPMNMQRDVFMSIVSREAAYPRVRTLFGAPPYAFLRAEDAGMLRAAGFASSRRNVAYDGFHVANYSQFGAPHLVDSYERQYRVAQEKDGEGAQVAFMALRRGGDPKVTFIVRIKKRARSVRAAMLRDATGKIALSFPRAGEVVRMRPTPAIIRMIAANAADATAVDVRVVAVRLSDQKAATAIISGVIQ